MKNLIEYFLLALVKPVERMKRLSEDDHSVQTQSF